MNPIETLIRQLRNQAILNPGATDSQLDRLRNLLGIELPEDVKTFYSLANGMPDLTYDDHQVSFWSIEKIETEVGRWHDNEIGFADFLIHSWRFIFRVSANGLVVVTENVRPGSPFEEIGTFTRFAEVYVGRLGDLRIL